MKKTITQHLYMALDYTADFRDKEWSPQIKPWVLGNESDRIYIGPVRVDVVIPDDFNPLPVQVAALEAEKAELLAKYQESVASINERLSKLQAITYEPSEA